MSLFADFFVPSRGPYQRGNNGSNLNCNNGLAANRAPPDVDKYRCAQEEERFRPSHFPPGAGSRPARARLAAQSLLSLTGGIRRRWLRIPGASGRRSAGRRVSAVSMRGSRRRCAGCASPGGGVAMAVRRNDGACGNARFGCRSRDPGTSGGRARSGRRRRRGRRGSRAPGCRGGVQALEHEAQEPAGGSELRKRQAIEEPRHGPQASEGRRGVDGGGRRQATTAVVNSARRARRPPTSDQAPNP